MLVTLVQLEKCDEDEDDDIICEIFEDYLDGVCGDVSDGEGDSEAIDVEPVATAGSGIGIDKTSFVESTMIQELIVNSRTAFASLKKDLVARF